MLVQGEIPRIPLVALSTGARIARLADEVTFGVTRLCQGDFSTTGERYPADIVPQGYGAAIRSEVDLVPDLLRRL